MESKLNLLIFYRINLVKYLGALLDYLYLCDFSVIYGMSSGSHWNSRDVCSRLTNSPAFTFFSSLQVSSFFSV